MTWWLRPFVNHVTSEIYSVAIDTTTQGMFTSSLVSVFVSYGERPLTQTG